MAQVKLTDIAKEMNGKYSNDGTIFRVKKYRSSNGAIIATGKQEAFRVMNPRDFKHKPAKGAELANMKRFGEAHRLSLELIQAGKYTDAELASMPASERERVEQLRVQLAEYQLRFDRQLTGDPDPQASLLPKTDPNYNHNTSLPQRRRYVSFPAFLRVLLAQERNK